jgi:truncated hemoglobin YjbI
MVFSELKVNRPELQKLYQKIGSEQKVLEIVRDFYGRMSRDILVGFFFDGRDVEKIAAGQTTFLLRAMGARPSYEGKPPAQAHDELPPILSGHFNRRLRILQDTLRDHGLNEEEQHVWMAFENAFREGIVREGS